MVIAHHLMLVVVGAVHLIPVGMEVELVLVMAVTDLFLIFQEFQQPTQVVAVVGRFFHLPAQVEQAVRVEAVRELKDSTRLEQAELQILAVAEEQKVLVLAQVALAALVLSFSDTQSLYPQ